MGCSEQRYDFFIPESCNATANASHKESKLYMLLGKLNELIHVGTNGLYPTLHRRYGVALPLQSHALSHDGSKLAVGNISRPSAMHTPQVAAKYEDLAWLQLCDKLWCCSFLFHHILFFTESTFQIMLYIIVPSATSLASLQVECGAGVVNDGMMSVQKICAKHSVNLPGVVFPELGVDKRDVHQEKAIVTDDGVFDSNVG